MGPDIKTTNNAATPVANDFARYLQGLLSGGQQTTGPLQSNRGSAPQNQQSAARGRSTQGFGGRALNTGGGAGASTAAAFAPSADFGSGVGALSQGAGKAISDFVASRAAAANTGGVDPGTMALIAALTAENTAGTNRQAGDLREAFGASGARFGTSLAKGEGMLRAESQRGLDSTIGSILVNQQNANVANLLSGISQMSQQGESAILPYLALLQLGLPQAENVVSPGVGSQLLSGAAGGAAAYLGRRK